MSRRLSCVAACVLAMAAAAAFGARRNAEFSADAGVARLDGTSYERVYSLIDYGPLDGRYHRLSELVWDLESVYGVRVSLALDVEDAVELRATFFSAFSEGTGEMVDYDWFLYDRPDFWTHRSRSRVGVKDALDVDLRGTVHAVRRAAVSVDAMLGWRYLNFRWEDRGMDYVYSSLGDPDGLPEQGYRYEQEDPDAVRDLSGSDNRIGILYEQEYHIPYVGLGAGLRAGQLEVRAEALYSPMVTAMDRDEHVLRELMFRGTFTGGKFFSWKASVIHRFRDRAFLTASYESRRIDEFRGDMRVSEAGGTGLGSLDDGASVEHESRQVTLAVGVDF